MQKRWSAAAIVDKVLKYIPEMENEIEKLKLSKDNAKKKQQEEQLQMSEKQSLTVSVNQVQDGQAIVQICKEEEPPLPHPNLHQVFSKFLDNIEAEQICITNASTLSICHNRICYQLHLQVTSIAKFIINIHQLYTLRIIFHVSFTCMLS